jgi:hypothetical protein
MHAVPVILYLAFLIRSISTYRSNVVCRKSLLNNYVQENYGKELVMQYVRYDASWLSNMNFCDTIFVLHNTN